jgi:hypothetical protein
MSLRPLAAVAMLGLGLVACASAQPPAAPRQVTAPMPPMGANANPADARVPGTRFNATGDVPCAIAANQPMRPCPFGVVRGARGEATVEVTKPDGMKRNISFRGGRAISADGSQADGSAGWRFESRQRDDGVFLITFGPERYEIFEAVVFGG